MNFDESQIYEPLENSDLISIILKDDKIFYSIMFEVYMIDKEFDRYLSHGILTDNGVALSSSVSLPFQGSFGVKTNNLYYFPWHAVKKSTDFSTRLLIGDFFLRIEANKDIEAIKPINVLNKELGDKCEILIKQSKDKLYEKLLPILKTFPEVFLPLNNTSEYSMLHNVYTELRNRYIIEAKKGLFESRYNENIEMGTFEYTPRYKPVPKDTNYSRERIIEEIKNYNIAQGSQGSYEDIMKTVEMAIVFTNFFGKHTVEETTKLILELFEINAKFVSKLYSNAISRISGKYSKKEKEVYELEKTVAEKIIFKLFLKNDEYIITDFKGKVSLPNAHLEYIGHIYLTNYQLIFPNIPKFINISTNPTSLPSAIIAGGIKAHIKSARKKFARAFKQNPDMFYIKNPYNIVIREKPKGDISPFNFKFTMSYNYENIYSTLKKYNHVITIKINRLKKTSSEDFKQKRKEVVNKFVDFFSQLPNTTCPKCLNIQDKSLKKCEKCGRKMNVTLKIK